MSLDYMKGTGIKPEKSFYFHSEKNLFLVSNLNKYFFFYIKRSGYII